MLSLASSDSVNLYTDAAGSKGFAAVFGHQWFVGHWKEDMATQSIAAKELFPIVLALEIWGLKLKNRRVLFMTDNAAVVEIINKTSSKCTVIMTLVRRLVLAGMRHNIHFRSKHIPGKSNVVADHLSRFDFQAARQVAPWLSPRPISIPQANYKL